MFLHLFVILFTVATEAGGTHPTGMHTCFNLCVVKNKGFFWDSFDSFDSFQVNLLHGWVSDPGPRTSYIEHNSPDKWLALLNCVIHYLPTEYVMFTLRDNLRI